MQSICRHLRRRHCAWIVFMHLGEGAADLRSSPKTADVRQVDRNPRLFGVPA